MTTAQFFRVLREYAALHRQTGVDYSEAVGACMMSFISGEMKRGSPIITEKDAISRASVLADRIYGAAHVGWVRPDVGGSG